MSSPSLPGLNNGMELRFHPDEEHYPTWHQEGEHPVDIPCFVVRGKHEYIDGTYDCVGYQFYFAENLAIGLGGIDSHSERLGIVYRLLCLVMAYLGYHRHDVEAVYVLFDDNGMPQHVYFSAHGLGQGMWAGWDECDKTTDGGLIVYIAWRSHATYPKPGEVTRLYGLADDLPSEGGRVIRVTSTQYLNANSYVHDFGSGIRIRNEIPRISNASISNEERVRLLRFRSAVRNRANAQYEDDEEP